MRAVFVRWDSMLCSSAPKSHFQVPDVGSGAGGGGVPSVGWFVFVGGMRREWRPAAAGGLCLLEV